MLAEVKGVADGAGTTIEGEVERENREDVEPESIHQNRFSHPTVGFGYVLDGGSVALRVWSSWVCAVLADAVDTIVEDVSC